MKVQTEMSAILPAVAAIDATKIPQRERRLCITGHLVKDVLYRDEIGLAPDFIEVIRHTGCRLLFFNPHGPVKWRKDMGRPDKDYPGQIGQEG